MKQHRSGIMACAPSVCKVCNQYRAQTCMWIADQLRITTAFFQQMWQTESSGHSNSADGTRLVPSAMLFFDSSTPQIKVYD